MRRIELLRKGAEYVSTAGIKLVFLIVFVPLEVSLFPQINYPVRSFVAFRNFSFSKTYHEFQ